MTASIPPIGAEFSQLAGPRPTYRPSPATDGR